VLLTLRYPKVSSPSLYYPNSEVAYSSDSSLKVIYKYYSTILKYPYIAKKDTNGKDTRYSITTITRYLRTSAYKRAIRKYHPRAILRGSLGGQSITVYHDQSTSLSPYRISNVSTDNIISTLGPKPPIYPLY
ncbi:hypothetical protein N7497_012226, partial [Penicillium chrysogenum]